MRRVKFIGGLALFVAVVTGTTLLLQSTLMLYRLAGWHAHWAAIILFVPLIVGLTFRFLRVPLPGLAAILGGAVSAAILYPIYRDYLFKDPPHPFSPVIFALLTAGVAYSATLRFGQKVAILKQSSPVANERDLHREGQAIQDQPQQDSKADDQGPVEATTTSGAISVLIDPKYSTLIAGLQLLVAALSLLLSIVSIWVLGG